MAEREPLLRDARRGATTPEIRRDAVLETLYPTLLDEKATTGHEGMPASFYERLAILASYFGNALPMRGGLNFGDPELRRILKLKAAEMTDQAMHPHRALQAERMRSQHFVGTDPGGFVPSPIETSSSRLRELLNTADPEQRARDLLLLEEKLKEDLGMLLSPASPPWGPRGTSPTGNIPGDWR